MDDRAQSIGLARFFISLVIGAFIFFIVTTIREPLSKHATSMSNSQTATQGTGWLNTLIDYLPVVFLLIAFFGLLVLAIYQREVIR